MIVDGGQRPFADRSADGATKSSKALSPTTCLSSSPKVELMINHKT
jgi:hypothetical protein